MQPNAEDTTSMELTAKIRFEDGGYWAEVVELPGCFASGGSLDELREALEEAISMCVEGPSIGVAQSTGPGQCRPLRVGEMKLVISDAS